MPDDAAFTWDSRTARPRSPAPDAAPSPPAPAPVPADHLMIPVAAWDKMLSQLGNLHEAGQQLADARERAAKAETEVAFLRERLAEFRERAAEPPAAPPVEEELEAPPASRGWIGRLRRAADALRQP